MKRRKVLFWITLFVYLVSETQGSVITTDITGNTVFGCQWSGGSVDSGVTCRCQSSAPEFFIQKGSIPSYDAQIIRINDCGSVRFGNNAISTMRNLRLLELSNIKTLHLDDSSLQWNAYVQPNDHYNSWENVPMLKIKIEKSRIKKIGSYTFQGQIKNIIIRDSIVEDIAPFAFSSLIKTQTIEFFNINVLNIQEQAFKKFPTDILTLTSSSFKTLPSRTFSDVTVLDSLEIKNCSFDTIKSSAFLIQKPKYFELANSYLNKVEGEGFKIVTRGSVNIKNNFFNETDSGAFFGISFRNEILTHEEIWFDNDTFNNLEKRSLDVNRTSFFPKYTNIVINQQCNCQYMSDNSDHEEFRCLFDDNKKVTLKEFRENNCTIFGSYSTIIIVLGVVLILFIIVVLGLVFYFKRVYKKHSEYITDKNGKPISLIMPDGRTYRETELHVVVERADLLTTDL